MKKFKIKWWQFIVGAVVTCVALKILYSIIIFVLCLFKGDFGETIKDQLTHLQEESGLVFPTGSKVVEFYYKPFVDPVSTAKVLIPGDSRDDFYLFINGVQDIRTNNFNVSWQNYPAWWKPREVIVEKVFMANEDNMVRIILTDEKINENYVVYMDCFYAH